MTQIASEPVAVLVVEDEPIILMSALDLVEAQGFEALSATSADEAILILEQRSEVQIVFTDIHMTGSMDGLELAAHVRSRWPPIKFIVVSGARKPTESEMPDGAVFFVKPYHHKDIGNALQQLAS